MSLLHHFSWVWYLVAVLVLVTVHEFGHFWVARRLGFRVLRFSVGFGRALWRRTGRDGTEFVIAIVPLGGYVKLLDEREGPVDPADLPRAFTRRPHWQRIAVLLAGPAANFLFAILVLAGMFLVQGGTELRAFVAPLSATSPAGQAGVRAGDEVLSVGGEPVGNQGEALVGLLDAVSGSGPVRLGLRDQAGAVREVVVDAGDGPQRRALAEPSALLAGLGLRFFVPARLGHVDPSGPAGRAGLREGDQVLAVGGTPVAEFGDIVSQVQAHPGETLVVRYLRAGGESEARVAVERAEANGKVVGRMQAGTPLLRQTRYGPVGALAAAAHEAWGQTTLQARLLWRMLTGRVSMKNLSGPITIAELAGDSASAGPAVFLNFLVLISLALGFMNLLPIPILDGGQVVLQAFEWLRGSPLSERAQVAGQQLGILLVVLLVSIALYNDITRQIG